MAECLAVIVVAECLAVIVVAESLFLLCWQHHWLVKYYALMNFS